MFRLHFSDLEVKRKPEALQKNQEEPSLAVPKPEKTGGHEQKVTVKFKRRRKTCLQRKGTNFSSSAFKTYFQNFAPVKYRGLKGWLT